MRAFRSHSLARDTKRRLEQAFVAYHEAVQADRYRVTARREGVPGALILDRGPDGQSRGWAAEELRRHVGRIAELCLRGETIYYTPISDRVHHLQVDDLTQERLAALTEAGYRPSVIIESSPQKYHAVINIAKIDNDDIERDTANRLVVSLNKKFGDPHFTGAIHPHRAPGSFNYKPKYRGEDGSYPIVGLVEAAGGRCALAEAQLAELRQGRERATAGKDHGRGPVVPVLQPVSAPTGGSRIERLYFAHYAHVRELLGGQVTDWSRVDSLIALRLRATGHGREEIAEAIRRCARRIRPPDRPILQPIERYAERAVRYAWSAKAEDRLRRDRIWLPQWRQIEAKALAEGWSSSDLAFDGNKPGNAI